jgi:hypothetical protein
MKKTPKLINQLLFYRKFDHKLTKIKKSCHVSDAFRIERNQVPKGKK